MTERFTPAYLLPAEFEVAVTNLVHAATAYRSAGFEWMSTLGVEVDEGVWILPGDSLAESVAELRRRGVDVVGRRAFLLADTRRIDDDGRDMTPAMLFVSFLVDRPEEARGSMLPYDVADGRAIFDAQPVDVQVSREVFE